MSVKNSFDMVLGSPHNNVSCLFPRAIAMTQRFKYMKKEIIMSKSKYQLYRKEICFI